MHNATSKTSTAENATYVRYCVVMCPGRAYAIFMVEEISPNPMYTTCAGSIPKELGTLGKLETLSIRGHDLTGTGIVFSLGGLANKVYRVCGCPCEYSTYRW